MKRTFRVFFFYFLAGLWVIIAAQSCTDGATQKANHTTGVDSVKYTEPEPPPIVRPDISYQLNKRKTFFQTYKDSINDQMLTILSDVNRVDIAHLKRLDSIIVPTPINLERQDYSPFPSTLQSIQDISKILIFAYYQEYFGAYEYGTLVRTGPTNMGKKTTKTPTGLFFTNWKSKESISTVSDEWILKWNFNISNYGGVGFHEYALPGYPASHSCLRLKSDDAMFFYHWCDQWKLSSKDVVLAKGTPVIIYGRYPFGKAKPWSSLVDNPRGINILTEELDSITAPFIKTILEEQNNRVEVFKRINAL